MQEPLGHYNHRQATFQTNYAKKNSATSGVNIIKKFQQWDKNGLARLSYETHTHRCNQDIADLGDSFYPTGPKTKSLNSDLTGHDGVFIVPLSKIDDYLAQFSPQILRLTKTGEMEPSTSASRKGGRSIGCSSFPMSQQRPGSRLAS